MKHAFGAFVGLFLLCSCSMGSDSVSSIAADSDTPTEVILPVPTQTPGPWQMIGVYPADQNIMTAGFLDQLHVATGGVIGQMGYSSDGAKTWLVTDAASDCRYGME